MCNTHILINWCYISAKQPSTTIRVKLMFETIVVIPCLCALYRPHIAVHVEYFQTVFLDLRLFTAVMIVMLKKSVIGGCLVLN